MKNINKKIFNLRINFRIANPTVFRAAIQLPLNRVVHLHMQQMCGVALSDNCIAARNIRQFVIAS